MSTEDCSFSDDGLGQHGLFGPWHRGPRVQRGDMAPILLRLLREKPMHGYEIIRTLEEKSHGMWRPSAGSVYPTLQLLEEQEKITSQEVGGKKIYSLTTKGTANAEESQVRHPWEFRGKHAAHLVQMRGSIREFMMALRQASFKGSDEQAEKVGAILAEATKKLKEVATESNTTR